MVLHISILMVFISLFCGGHARAASFEPYFELSLLGDIYPVDGAGDLNNGQLHGRFKLLNQREKSQVYFDLGAGGLVGKKAENYFIVPQAYVSLQPRNSLELTFGRKLKNYSQLDTYWLLGDIMPLFRWDAGRPEAQGLPGIFATYKPVPGVEIDLVGSYLFLPSQGPSFSIVDGKLTSGNPWFSRPVDILDLGLPYDLQYSVNTPEISDIVFKPTLGASILLQPESDGLWARGSYLLKQKNEVVTPFSGTLNLSNDTGDIQVYPAVAEHKVGALDIGYKGEEWAITVSGLFENDVKFDIESAAWIYPIYSDQYKVGMNFSYQVSSFHSLELGALRTFDNRVKIGGGPAGVDSLEIFSFRNQYDNVVDLRLTSVFWPQAHGFLFKTKGRVAYDYTAETTLLSMELIYSPLMDASAFVRADLFGGERPENKIYNNLLVNYLNRDRFQAGVRYVF